MVIFTQQRSIQPIATKSFKTLDQITVEVMHEALKMQQGSD